MFLCRVMTSGDDKWDGIFYLTLTPVMDYYILPQRDHYHKEVHDNHKSRTKHKQAAQWATIAHLRASINNWRHHTI